MTGPFFCEWCGSLLKKSGPYCSAACRYSAKAWDPAPVIDLPALAPMGATTIEKPNEISTTKPDSAPMGAPVPGTAPKAPAIFDLDERPGYWRLIRKADRFPMAFISQASADRFLVLAGPKCERCSTLAEAKALAVTMARERRVPYFHPSKG